MRAALASSPGFPALGGAWGRGYIGLGPGPADRSLDLTSTVLTLAYVAKLQLLYQEIFSC